MLVVIAVGAAPAGSETLATTQAAESAASFLVTATPPTVVGAICVIDTGVDVTPDTASVTARISLWDDLVGDTSPTRHGTLIATLIAAPLNGWGMVGLWPSARIVSIRANTTGADEFTVPSYYQALQRCDELSGYFGIKVVLMALGSEAPLTAEETAALGDRIASARAHGLNVIVAAGNNSGGPLETPAQLPGVFSLGGSANDGSRCAISAVGARLQAPGCGVSAIDTSTGAPLSFQGTTAAAAVTAAAIAALRSWRPDVGVDAAEDLFAATATAAPGGSRINVASAFRAAGLGSVVDTAPPIGQEPQAPPPRDTLPDLAPPMARLPKPKVAVRRLPRKPAVLELRLRNLPSATIAVVNVSDRRGRARRLHRLAQQRTRSRLSRVRVRSRRALRVTIHYVDPGQKRPDSQRVIVRMRGRR